MSAVWKTRDDLEAEVARLLEYNTASYDAINAAMRRAEAAEGLVEELQKQRRCVKHPDAERRLDGCAECVADEILIARRKTEAAEAGRDHLRARLQQLMANWRLEGVIKDQFHATMGIGWKACAADLLAVLTEPPQEDIRGNGPINAVGPALDTEGDTP